MRKNKGETEIRMSLKNTNGKPMAAADRDHVGSWFM